MSAVFARFFPFFFFDLRLEPTLSDCDDVDDVELVDEEEVLLAPLSRVGMAALEVEEDNGKRERDDEVVEEEAAPTQDLKRARLADY